MIVCIAGVPASVQGTTHRVEKDGSGDFSVIQDAVNASAPGDTVLIGSGEYTDYADFQLDCCLVMPTYIGIPTRDLTLIGVHRDSVIVGPAADELQQETILGMRLGSSRGLSVQGLTLQYGTYGIRIMDFASVRDIELRDCWIGALALPDSGASLEQCVFRRCGSFGIAGSDGSRDILVRDSVFIDNGSSINFTWSEEPVVERCTFSGTGTTRVVASGAGTRLSLRDCVIEGGSNYGVSIRSHAQAELTGNYIYTTGATAVSCRNTARFEARNNRFVGGWHCTMFIANQHEPVIISDNDFERGSGYMVGLDDFNESAGLVTLPLAGNYWGTTDADSIAAYIHDGNDDPDIHGFVEFEPFLEVPVPTEKSSISGLKALFSEENSQSPE